MVERQEIDAETTNRAWQITTLKSFDGTKIRFGHFKGAKKARHTLVLVNGRSEWIEKYNHLYQHLRLRKDCDILTWDHRGQGGSGGLRSHVDSYDDFISDGRSVIEKALGDKAAYTILAHSMGGLISTYGTLKGYFKPNQLILSSPLFMLPNHPVQRVFYIPLANLACNFNFGRISPGVGGRLEGFSKNTLTRSFKGYQKVASSPYPGSSPTFGWLAATKAATDFIQQEENLAKLTCPTLVLGGSEEAVVDHNGFSNWVSRAHKFSHQLVRFHNIPGARHEILNEISSTLQEVQQQILLWNQQNQLKSEAFLSS